MAFDGAFAPPRPLPRPEMHAFLMGVLKKCCRAPRGRSRFVRAPRAIQRPPNPAQIMRAGGTARIKKTWGVRSRGC